MQQNVNFLMLSAVRDNAVVGLADARVFSGTMRKRYAVSACLFVLLSAICRSNADAQGLICILIGIIMPIAIWMGISIMRTTEYGAYLKW